jgi:two-component system, chemotaxis family, protein-glutamate methylesterase/glutaminase
MAVRVLIVDDSPLLRRGVRSILESGGMVVAGECGSGTDAVVKVAALRPDVVTMDLDMPGLDGLATIERIMADHPTPILVVTGDPAYRGLDGHFEALTRGAIDLVARPARLTAGNPDADRLIALVRIAAGVPVVPHVRGSARHRNNRPTSPYLPQATARLVGEAPPGMVVIGASTGGPGAIRSVLAGLTSLPAPIVVVQHMAEEFGEGFVRWLGTQVAMPVHEATPRTRVRPGHAYVAVRGPHLRIGSDGVLAAATAPSTPHRPSIDLLFTSAAQCWGPRALGILLTGMGDDGAEGLGAIALAGGLTLAQDEESSVVFGMPGAAIERGAARLVLGLDAIPRVVRDACRARPQPT